MSLRRVAVSSVAGDEVQLDAEQTHYVTRVLRLTPGTRIEAFDGAGQIARGALGNRDGSWFIRVEERHEPRERNLTLTVATATPKGERAEWLVEKLAELGVDHLVWLITQRSVVELSPDGSKMRRFRRLAEQAARQSNSNRVMRISPPVRYEPFLERVFDRRIVADFQGPSITAIEAESPSQAAILVGPEGGFTESELCSAIDAGYTPKTLSDSILRVETAAVVAAALALAPISRADPGVSKR